jgi:hypothetical protein
MRRNLRFLLIDRAALPPGLLIFPRMGFSQSFSKATMATYRHAG